MKQVSGKELGRVIERRGWLLARISGSHIDTMAWRRERIVVPVHGNKPLKIGLLRSLMRIADPEEIDL
ncbi:MAG: type II toxin-antitoxin system HicA family toxin [Verrucomicrobiae bacterium]|nr:type II toxin-antitoxin system HicA family toxin [Verrucomicrobiae bacterium]